MQKCYVFTLLAVFILLNGPALAVEHRYEAYLYQQTVGNEFYVDVLIKNVLAPTDNLGNGTFFIDFNMHALQFVGKVPAADGPWDADNAPTFYSDVSEHLVERDPLSRVSLNFIRVIPSPYDGGIPVPSTLTRVGRFKFLILDPNLDKQIGWNNTFFGVMNWTLDTDLSPFFNLREEQPQVGWTLPIAVNNGTTTQVLTIAGDPNAGNGFDVALDIAAPPAGNTYYAFLSLGSVFPYRLFTDYRYWSSPFEEGLDWLLQVINAGSATTVLTWEPQLLPAEGLFLIWADGLSPLNMNNNNSITFSGDNIVHISYRFEKEIQYHFTHSGWFLVSLPVNPTDKSVAALFPGALDGVAFSWDPVQMQYIPNTTLETGKGYWIALADAADYSIIGHTIKCVALNCEPGWHLVGGPYGRVDMSSPDDNPDGSVLLPAYGWDNNQGVYVPVTDFEPGAGYWLLIWQACTLTIDASSGLNKDLPNHLAGEYDDFYARYGKQPPLPPLVNQGVAQPFAGMPVAHSLYDNFPNPFNPCTCISFVLTGRDQVELAIYNLRGEKIRDLFNATQQAGYHQIFWDGKNEDGEFCSTGIYFVSGRLGTTHFTKKMTMIK